MGRWARCSDATCRLALHMLRQHTSFGGTLAHHDVCPTPPYPRPRQELETRLATSVSSSAQRTTSSTFPPPRGNVRKLSGGSAHLAARARSAHAIGAERIARSADQAAAGARARSAHAIGAERVARGGDGSRAAPAAPPGAQVRSALGAERRAPSAERRVPSARRRSDARRRRPGAQRPRHRRRARSARRRWLRASGCPTPHTTAGRLLPASATIKKKWVTSPGPGPLLIHVHNP